MFEITPDDIALLHDENLRSLVGLLCEAELKSHGFSASFVTWGGNQNAADGGVDVRVALPDATAIEGFVPRPTTAFQVKKSDISRADIRTEMRPNGAIRSSIRDLADRSGAYIIVSSGGTSDTALQNRRAAMAEAVNDLPNASALTLDFYDRGRLASWVKDHTGLVLWVREKIGHPIHGWHPYGAWAYAPEGVSGKYLSDGVRIRTDTDLQGEGVQALEGIERIRDRLRHRGKVARLIGLSGFGKTRLVQALFDDRVGEQSLDSSLAAYTDVADGPDPPPTTLLSELIALRKRAILVIDNCPPDLHRRLSELCRLPESSVSLITVEYDICEDQPEETEVFELEPSSTDLIEKLVKRRFPHLSPVDARTIAEFSGGNARIAMVLSETVGREETVAGMSDEDLFKRLFQQRHGPSEFLHLVAQVLSLVYSFQGEDLTNDQHAELFRLAALVGKSTQEIFQGTAELRRRGLIQQRGAFRAVLPQAVANRLAAVALQNIPYAAIEAHLIYGAPERLIRSFSRRLRYLDSSQEARGIVERWLKPGGWLENVGELDDLGMSILTNVAPVAPEAALSTLERAMLHSESEDIAPKCGHLVPLLRSLAYDAKLFERCVRLILRIAGSQESEKDSNDASKTFASLFPIYLSGTHATIDQRLAVIKSLLCSDEAKNCTFGLMALRTALEAVHFGAGYNFEFGARSRDYGYWPRTKDDEKQWFGQTLSLVETLACSNDPLGSQVRTVLADRFRGLWTSAAAHDDLERICHSISRTRFWTEGWIAVRQTIHYDSKGFTPEISTQLASLEELLRPRDLVQRVRSMVLSEDVIFIGLDSTYDETTEVEKTVLQVETMARNLGKTVAVDQTTFSELLPELIVGSSQQLWNFAGGLAEGTEEPRVIWDQLVRQLAATPINQRNPHVLRGFLSALNETNPNLVNALLDDALERDGLAEWYPVLQTAVGIDKKGVDRLLLSLELGKAWIGTYRYLVMGGITHRICGEDFNRLLFQIASKPEGLDVATEILYMRLAFEEGRNQSSVSQIIDIGCELMRRIAFGGRMNPSVTHKLSTIAKSCLVGEQGAATVREICHNLKQAVSKSEASAFYQDDLLKVLLDVQPFTVLESLCGGDASDPALGIRILEHARQLRRHPFDGIQETDLLNWCDQQPHARYPAVALGITAFRPSSDAGRPEWTGTARKLLDKAPDRVEVIKKFMREFSPVGWFGSQSAIVESNAKLLDDLAGYLDPLLVEFIRAEKIKLAEAIKAERQREVTIAWQRDERFE